MNSSLQRLKFPQSVIVRSPGLLPMLYTISELSEELRIPHTTLRGWLIAGAPYQRDDNGHLWVNGEQFSAWVKNQHKPRTPRRLNEGEGYCLHCNQIIRIHSPQVHVIKGKLIHIRGICPVCGHKINRGDRYGRTG
jgi:hypothetical protein